MFNFQINTLTSVADAKAEIDAASLDTGPTAFIKGAIDVAVDGMTDPVVVVSAFRNVSGAAVVVNVMEKAAEQA